MIKEPVLFAPARAQTLPSSKTDAAFCKISYSGKEYFYAKKQPKNMDLLVLIDQKVLHRHSQKTRQRQQIVHRGQALAVLPLVDSLRVFKPKIGLNVAHAQPGLLALPLDAATGCGKVNNREKVDNAIKNASFTLRSRSVSIYHQTLKIITS